MPGRADRVQTQLAGERSQIETPPHLRAVDGETAGAGRGVFLPGGERLAVGAEQPQPQPHRPGAVAGPVVRADQPGGQAGFLAEEDEVGREIQPVEVAAAVGQQRLGDARGVESENIGARRGQVADTRDHAGGVEAGHQHGARPAGRQIHQRPRRLPGHRRADDGHVVDIDAVDGEGVRIQRQQRRQNALGVVDRDRGLQPGEQGGQRLGRQRVGERLV
jgi:hypothetical protein